MTIINENLRSNGQKHAGQNVQSNLQLLPLIMNNIPQAVFWKDRDLVYLGCNQAFAEDAGFASPEELVGKTDFDMPWKDQAELYRADDQLILQKGEPKINYEEPQTTPDGSIIWLRTSKIPVQENGQTIAVLGMYEDITERKRVEEASKEERQRFQTILETIRVPTIISRLSDGIVLYANEALAQVSQVNLDKLIGFKTGNFYANPDDRKAVIDSLRERGHITDFEVQFRRTDGSLYWALLSSRIVNYEGETCVLSTYIDITERKRAEDALRQSEATLSSSLRVAQMGHWEFDIPTQLFTFNDQYYSLHGTTAQEVGGYQMSVQRFAQEFVHPEDAPTVGQATQQAMETTDPNFQVQIEARVLRTSGEVRWVTVWFRVEKDAQGRTIKLHGVNQDITERKQAETEVQGEKSLSDAIINGLPGIFYLFDTQGKMIRWNKQYEEVLGYTTEEIATKGAMDPIAEEDRERAATAIGRAFIEGQGTVEANVVTKDGRRIPYYFAGLRLTLGDQLYVAGTGIDITERKRLEAQVQEAFERRGLQVRLSTQVSQSIASATSLEELYERVVTQVKEQFGYYHTQLLRYDASQEAVVLVTGYGEVGAKMLAAGHRLPMGEGLIGTAAATGETVLRPMLESDPDWQPNPLLPETRGEIAVPIKLENTILGVLDVQSNVAGAIDADDQLLLEGLCGQIATAIESTRLRQEMSERLEEINRLYRAMSREGWQAYREGQNIATGFMFDQAGLRPIKDVELADELFANIPLVVPGGEVIGNLAIADDPQRPISPDDETFLQQVSEQMALALESARLFEQTEQQRGQLNEALNIARLANWEYDVKKDRFIFNDHFYSIFHTSVQEVGGYEISSAEYAARFVHPEDVPMVGGEIGKALASTDRHYNVHLEHRILFADGGIGYISVDVHIERDEQGNILRYYGANQDITERKKAEEILRVSEAQLSEALNMAKLAHWEYDLEKDIFTFNDQFYSIFHTTADQVGGYELSSARYAQLFVHPDDAALVGEEIGKAIASTDRYYTKQLEHRILFADGGVGYISVDINIERDENGKITRWYGANQDITERKKAEEILRVNEARLSEALNIAKLANWEYDVNRDRFIFNDHFYSIFRTSVQEVGGYEISSAEYAARFVHPEDVPMVGGEIGKALASTDRHYNVHLEHRILFADGGIGYISVDVHIERDEQGNILRYYGANQDITERKRAEETIKAEQQRTQTILESVTVPMVITRLSDNQLTFVNAPAIQVTQYQYEEVINQPAPNFYYNLEDRNKFITELRAKSEVSDMVVQLRRKDGEAFWALLSARIFSYQGEGSILTTFLDITDRIHAEEAVAKRATELATVAQVSTTASTVLDPDQLLQAVVDLTKERFGLYHAHIYLADDSWKTLLLAAGAGEIGRKLVAEEHAIPLSIEQSLVARAARERRAIIVNDVNSEPGYLPNPLLLETCAEMAVPMIVGDKVLGVFDVQSNDPSGFSDEDANIYITLAAQVGVALQNARLYMSQAATLTQLRELDKLKSSFLANMSHELRTPLNSILGFTDVMLEELDGPLTDHMDNDLRLIQKNGQHLLHLINDVLDMAKIEAGRMNLNPESFQAQEVLEEVSSITSTLASEKNLSLYINEDSDKDVKIYADRTRLRQVMINLVNNSIKFTDQGKVILNISRIDGARVLISVKDTGIGIPPEKLEAIFQEFTQVDSSTTRKAGGTGLGLPISRRLVEMHGGRLWAESTGIPGEGSTFFVELPIEARITEVVEKQAS